jgi:undecaprenyl-diphosphatase
VRGNAHSRGCIRISLTDFYKPPFYLCICMDILSLLVLGVVQGITEWIPISSKSQVTFVYLTIFKGNISSILPILLYAHLGTLLAASLYFRKEIGSLVCAIREKPLDIGSHANGKAGFLFTALLFTGLLGVPLLLLEKTFFPNLDAGLLYAIMGAGLIITGFLLLSHKGEKTRTIKEVTWKDGVLTGLLQGLSTLPGISRSGTSTTGLIWRGFDSESSFYLSFFLSIPTVFFAEILLYVGGGLTTFPVMEGIVLFVSSFIVGYLTLDTLLKVVRKVNIAYVVLALGIIIILVGVSGIG